MEDATMALFGLKPHERIVEGEPLIRQWRAHLASQWLVIIQTVGVVLALYMFHRLIYGSADQSVWFFDSVAWYGSLAAIVRLAYRASHWWHTIVLITDKRFMQISGIITSEAAMMPMTKVTDLKFKQPLLGGVFGFTTLRIESAGQNQDLEQFKFVPDPEEVEAAIAKLQFGIGSELGSKTTMRKMTTRERRRARRRQGTMDAVTQTWTTRDDDGT
jgi:membrane protein YdbS with pleckstrin-like domain